MNRLSIGIAGAGIGGLAAAALLSDLGHRITLLDQFDTPAPVGSGLVIQPVGQAVLDIVGAGPAARGWGRAVHRMLGHEGEAGRIVLDVSYDRSGKGWHGLAIHRAALFQALFDAAMARPLTLETGVRITGRDGPALLDTSGRRHGPFDLIVDATGAGSALSPLRSRPLPYGAIWGVVDWPATNLPSDELRQCYRRASRMIGVLPIGLLPGDTTQKAAVFWSLPSGGHADWLAGGIDSWKAEAIGLWPEVAPFLRQIADPAQMTMARYSHGTLRQPYGDGIAHIGDAAHRTSPQLGQGANMALLDALALARALERHRHCLPDALRAYGRGRRWHVATYQGMSAAFTPQYQSDSRSLPVLRDHILAPLSQVWPIPPVLSALVRGTMLPALGSLGPVSPTARTAPSTPVSQSR